MKYSTTFVSVLAGVSTVAGAVIKSRGVPTHLIPPLGIKAGTDPDGHGNCKGANGILIPCSCPPSQAVLVPVCPFLFKCASIIISTLLFF